MTIPVADIGDILGSPVWTFLATVFAAVAIWVSVWLYRRQRTRKSLTYGVTVTELVSVHQAAMGRIKILFDKEEIEQVHLVEARIENDGNVPITVEDFQQVFIFDLGEGATALTADITKRTPEDLPAEAYPSKNEIEIQPLLLNPGDGLAVKVFARNLQQRPVAHCRIVGVSKLRDAAANRQGPRTLRKLLIDLSDGMLFFVVVTGVVASLGSLLFSTVFSSEKDNESLVRLKNGTELCGNVLQTSDQRIVFQLAKTGKIRTLDLSEVQSIRDDSC